MEELLSNIGNWLATEGIKVVLVAVVLFIACKLINFLMKKFEKKLEKKNVDRTLKSVFIPVLRRTIKVLLFVCAIGYLGFETSSISAAILSVGATIGLALQGSLSNFAGGILIVALRPYKLDDYISVDGQEGTVSEITLFYTYLTTTDNKVIVIPNSKASNTCVVNYSKNKTRREDMSFSISYDEDFEKAKKVIAKVIDDNKSILKDPTPFINIKEHGDNAIIILARYWTNAEDYWNVHWYMLEAVKTAFDKEGISIPYPQIDVHMDKTTKQ